MLLIAVMMVLFGIALVYSAVTGTSLREMLAHGN